MDEILSELRALRAEVSRLQAPAAVSLTILETAARLRCSRAQVFNLLKAGDLKRGRRAGRHGTVTVASIEAYEAGPGSAALPEARRPTAPQRPFNEGEQLAALKRIMRRGT